MKTSFESGESASLASSAHMRLKLKDASMSLVPRQSPLNWIPPYKAFLDISSAV
jgi:hypothetical protein